MATPKNQAAWLKAAGSPLEVGDAPMPTPGPGEIIVKNAAVAINPLDCHMQDHGVFIQQWPAIFGCDVAGMVHEVGSDVQRFKIGDRVIGHTINLNTSKPQDGAYALYTVVPANKAAILPDTISFTDGVVLPLALEAAICALSLKDPGEAFPGVPTPALALPYPIVRDPVPSLGRTLIVYGGSSSVGSMVTQIATATGIHVISIVGAHNFPSSKSCGAAQVFDRKAPEMVEKVIEATRTSKYEFIGIFDAISSPETYSHDLAILEKLGGGHLACTHPPPPGVAENVQAGMIWPINDIATPIWEDYVTQALMNGKLRCFPPPNVVGKGMEYIEEALKKLRAGVSATKLVVEL